MIADRYTRLVLTVIAVALLYLCVVLSPMPVATAQTALRPGDPTGPAQVVIVGWQTPQGGAFPVSVTNTVQVTGQVTTERSGGRADRVVLVGWEERGNPEQRRSAISPFDGNARTGGLPVNTGPR